MFERIKKYLHSKLIPKNYRDNKGLKDIFLEKNNYIVLYDVKWHTLRELKFLLIHLLTAFSRNEKIDPLLTNREKLDVYLTDFLFNKIDGISEYTDDIYRVKNDAIELEFLLGYIVDNDLNYGIVGSNYRLALRLLPEIYNIIDQLDVISERIFKW